MKIDMHWILANIVTRRVAVPERAAVPGRAAVTGRVATRIGGSVLCASLLLSLAFARVDPAFARSGKDPYSPTSSAPANKYIGAEKCKMCHQAEASGNPYGAWQKSDHSKAFERLASLEAKKAGKAKGIDDPQKSDACLKCHTTAFGVAADEIKKGFDPKQGVQCETCHGPGELHMKARLAAAGADEGKDAPLPKIPAGEIIVKVDQTTCVKCHNEESPTFKPFCFYERRAKIQHFDPRKTHTKEESLICGCAKCECKHGSEPDTCGVDPKDKNK